MVVNCIIISQKLKDKGWLSKEKFILKDEKRKALHNNHL